MGGKDGRIKVHRVNQPPVEDELTQTGFDEALHQEVQICRQIDRYIKPVLMRPYTKRYRLILIDRTGFDEALHHEVQICRQIDRYKEPVLITPRGKDK